LRLFGLSLLALVAGCNWVSPEDLDARLGQLDDDGDGFTRDGNGDPARIDCDDADAAIYPGAVEVWYDGVDQNCDRLNDFDQDGDGVVIAGCADPRDCRPEIPGGDCDDLNAEVFPAAVDEWYDGLDSNCDAANDFDQDADGFVLDGCTDPVYCGAMVPGGDCDDWPKGSTPARKRSTTTASTPTATPRATTTPTPTATTPMSTAAATATTRPTASAPARTTTGTTASIKTATARTTLTKTATAWSSRAASTRPTAARTCPAATATTPTRRSSPSPRRTCKTASTPTATAAPTPSPSP
jgi:hypothetical protein